MSYFSRTLAHSRSEQGQTLVELALILPVLLLVLLGVIEFGWVFFQTIVITSGAREGARLGVVSDDPTGADEGDVITRVEEAASWFAADPDSGGEPAVGQLLVAVTQDGSKLSVSVRGGISLFTPLIRPFLANSSDDQYYIYSTTAVMRMEH